MLLHSILRFKCKGTLRVKYKGNKGTLSWRSEIFLLVLCDITALSYEMASKCIPFGTIENGTLLRLFEFDKPSVVDSVLSFEITSHLTNLPNLQEYDIDEHLPSNIDSSYHTVQNLPSYSIPLPLISHFKHEYKKSFLSF